MSALAQPILINQQIYGFLKFGSEINSNYFIDLNYNQLKKATPEIYVADGDYPALDYPGHLIYRSDLTMFGYNNGSDYVYPITASNVIAKDTSITASANGTTRNAEINVKRKAISGSDYYLSLDTNAITGGLWIDTDANSLLWTGAKLGVKANASQSINTSASGVGITLYNLASTAGGLKHTGTSGLSVYATTGLKFSGTADVNGNYPLMLDDDYVKNTIIDTYIQGSSAIGFNTTTGVISLTLASSNYGLDTTSGLKVGQGNGILVSGATVSAVANTSQSINVGASGIGVTLFNSISANGGLKHNTTSGLSVNFSNGLKIGSSVLNSGYPLILDEDYIKTTVMDGYIDCTAPLVYTLGTGNIKLELYSTTTAPTISEGINTNWSGLGVVGGKLAVKIANDGTASGLILNSSGLKASGIALSHLSLTNSTFTFGANYVYSSAQPLDPYHLANKEYVDNIAQGIKWKEAVKCATTANITLSGTQTIDTISVLAGDRVLVKDQTNKTQNGIYVVSTGAWTRALDSDTADEIEYSAMFVTQGVTNAGKTFNCNIGAITEWSTDIIYILMSSNAVSYTGGNGITIANNIVSAKISSGLIIDTADNNKIKVDLINNAPLSFDTIDTNKLMVYYDDETIGSVSSDGKFKLAIKDNYKSKKYNLDWTQGASLTKTINHSLGTTAVTTELFMEVEYTTGVYKYVRAEALIVVEDDNNITVEFTNGLTTFVTNKKFRIKVIG